jgi:hypothetical protein
MLATALRKQEFYVFCFLRGCMVTARPSNFQPRLAIERSTKMNCLNAEIATIGLLANYPLCNPDLAAENRELIESEKLS